jgi:Holliday junction resolvase
MDERPRGAVQSLERQIVDRLADSFEGAGWSVRRRVTAAAPTDRMPVEVDLVVTQGDKIYVIEVKAGRDNRRAHIRELFSEAALRSEIAAQRLGGKPLPVVGSPRLTDAVVDDLRRYAETFTPHLTVVVADGEGRMESLGPDVPALDTRGPARETIALSPKTPQTLFTDLNQWLLKVMLAHRLPPDTVGAPRRTYASTAAIARAGGVSVATAWRLIGALESQGFAEVGKRSIALVRLRQLMDRWRLSTDTMTTELPVVFSLPASNPRSDLRERLRRYAALPTTSRAGDRQRNKPRVALGLFAASSMLGHGFVSGAPVHMLADALDEDLLSRLGMTPAAHDETPHVIARVPRFPESVFRGAVVRDGLPIADIVQCWLDVSHHPARGKEQADRLWKRVLEPSIGT